jgi:hypothetical protein
MREIFGAPDKPLALQNALQRKHGHNFIQPRDHFGASVLSVERFETVNSINEVDQRAVRQGHHSLRQDFSVKFLAKIQDSDVLPLGQIDPDIRVQSCGGSSLKNRRGHAGDLKPYLFLSERVNKLCERRKF